MLKAWRDRDKQRDKTTGQAFPPPSNVNSGIQRTPSPRKPPDKTLYDLYEHKQEQEQGVVETEIETLLKQVHKDLTKFGRDYDGYYEAYDKTRALLNAYLNTMEGKLRIAKEFTAPTTYH